MTDIKMKETISKKLEKIILKNRKPILAAVGVLVVAAVAVCVVVGVKDSQSKKGLAALDAIEYAYTVKSTELTDAEVSARQEKALADVAAYCGMNGLVGARANFLAAEVNFAKKDYSSALAGYVAAIANSKNMYLEPICRHNAAVCCEELGNKEEAYGYYVSAAETKDYYLASHALFSAARVQESMGNLDKAVETYKKVTEKYANDVWANMSQSRIIDLQAKGKTE